MADRYCAENIVFQAGRRTIINDISLSLSQGELIALIGPNGAGKSTLLRLLTGYLKPASGHCLLAENPSAHGVRTRPPAGGNASKHAAGI